MIDGLKPYLAIRDYGAAVVPSDEPIGRFLLHFLTAFYATFREFGRGGNQEALNCESVGNWRIPVPPENEQRATSDALNDELLGCHEAESHISQELNLLREYRTRLIADVVTGKLGVRETAAQLPDEADDTDSLDDFESESVDEDVAAGSLEEPLEHAET